MISSLRGRRLDADALGARIIFACQMATVEENKWATIEAHIKDMAPGDQALLRWYMSDGADLAAASAPLIAGLSGAMVSEALSRSTGRTEPGNLKEQLAMQAAKADPSLGTVLPTRLNDWRWPASEGWVKISQHVNGVEIHYNYNTVTGRYADFKYKHPTEPNWEDRP